MPRAVCVLRTENLDEAISLFRAHAQMSTGDGVKWLRAYQVTIEIIDARERRAAWVFTDHRRERGSTREMGSADYARRALEKMKWSELDRVNQLTLF